MSVLREVRIHWPNSQGMRYEMEGAWCGHSLGKLGSLRVQPTPLTLHPSVRPRKCIGNHDYAGKKQKETCIYDIKIREALEIRRHNCGPGKGLNEDMGANVKTDIWDPVLRTMQMRMSIGTLYVKNDLGRASLTP